MNVNITLACFRKIYFSKSKDDVDSLLLDQLGKTSHVVFIPRQNISNLRRMLPISYCQKLMFFHGPFWWKGLLWTLYRTLCKQSFFPYSENYGEAPGKRRGPFFRYFTGFFYRVNRSCLELFAFCSYHTEKIPRYQLIFSLNTLVFPARAFRIDLEYLGVWQLGTA